MTLSRRNIMIGLGGLLAGGGALVGTGAFTTVQAERSVSVETAGDGNAFLTLEPTTDPNGQQYASINNNGLLEVAIPNVNLNAVTRLDDVFQVTNNGTQAVVLYFQEQPGSDNSGGKPIDVVADTDELVNWDDDLGVDDQPTGNGNVETDLADLSGPSSPDQYAGYGDLGVLLEVGDTLKVGFYIDTSDDDPTDELGASGSSDVEAGEALMENLTIWASADAATNGNYQFEAASP